MAVDFHGFRWVGRVRPFGREMGLIWAWRAEAAVIPGNRRTFRDHARELRWFEFECKPPIGFATGLVRR
jgi:hypothetical protein